MKHCLCKIWSQSKIVTVYKQEIEIIYGSAAPVSRIIKCTVLPAIFLNNDMYLLKSLSV